MDLRKEQIGWLSNISDTAPDPYRTMASDAIMWDSQEIYEILRKTIEEVDTHSDR